MNLRPVIAELAGNMNLVGAHNIIAGTLACLTVIGAIWGIPMILSGLRLNQAIREFNTYLASCSEADLLRGLRRQSRFFFFQKVLAIISLCFIALYILFLIFVVVSWALR
jgi:hypothetical protein